jgi:uncharacterized protein (TIGR01244 family)
MNAQRLSTLAVVLMALALAPNYAAGQATSAEKTTSISSVDFAAPQVWGAAGNVIGVKHLYLSGQPDQATLETAVEHGVGVVINLRGPREYDWDENGAATKLGLTYYNVPITGREPGFDADTIARISTLVAQHRDTKVLVHCASGNRVSGWFAVHLAQDHGMPVEESIEMSRLAGLTNTGMKSRVREFLATKPSSGNEQ